MRILSVAAMLGVIVVSQSAYSKESAAKESLPKAPTSRILSAEESQAAGEAARRKADAQQRAWDEKTKSITRGICSGC
jgi:hypothetical protein